MNVNENGFKLFWENYNRAYEWQNSSRISHWQARARALEVENALLRDFIHRELQENTSQRCTQPSHGPSLNQSSGDNASRPVKIVKPCEPDIFEAHPSDEVEEELLAFYEKTIRHQLEREKKRSEDKRRDSEQSLSDDEKVASMGPVISAKKSTDMALLYGTDSPKILSMELSMQINFDMNRNKSHAQLWPNIPLRLS